MSRARSVRTVPPGSHEPTPETPTLATSMAITNLNSDTTTTREKYANNTTMAKHDVSNKNEARLTIAPRFDEAE
ncbi:MAG: hypothetical protein EAZ61_10200 [Oscillatoriales cyanobacterium]|nr:MAG: hypothetical protein EAZ61_10200 [Oscillatoriales cyanobacterium]